MKTPESPPDSTSAPTGEQSAITFKLGFTNASYLQHKITHRNHYSPTASWYVWQTRKLGRGSLFKQNDRAYGKQVRKVPGLHELHIAEEIHRFFELNVNYLDHDDKVKIDPEIPPMGDPYNFNGSKWHGRKFNQMWEFWMQCYPAHAYDIERELYRSRNEGRKAWWDHKNRSRIILRESTDKRSRPDDAPGPAAVAITKIPKITPSCSKGHFELTYMDTPCQVCGSYEHPALQKREDDYGDIRYHYTCPMAENDDWESWYMKPCPIKMAIICDYNEYEVLKSWHRMIHEGWGKSQTSRILRRFLNMANKACREHGG